LCPSPELLRHAGSRPAAPASTLNCVAGTYGSDGFHELGLAQSLDLLAPVVHRLVARELIVFFVDMLVLARGDRVRNRIAVELAAYRQHAQTEFSQNPGPRAQKTYLRFLCIKSGFRLGLSNKLIDHTIAGLLQTKPVSGRVRVHHLVGPDRMNRRLRGLELQSQAPLIVNKESTLEHVCSLVARFVRQARYANLKFQGV
jgi:hypothetical protein